MSWIAYHGKGIFFLFVFPLTGLVLDAFFTTKKIIYILIGAALFLAPAVSDYSYIIPLGYRFFFLVVLSCVYALFSKSIETDKGKVISAMVIAGLFFILLLIVYSISSFFGSQTVMAKWKTGGYKIEYVKDQGFAGGPLLTYELSKYSQVPLFIKKIETVRVDKDSTEKCQIVFQDSKIIFDKCNVSIEKVE